MQWVGGVGSRHIAAAEALPRPACCADAMCAVLDDIMKTDFNQVSAGSVCALSGLSGRRGLCTVPLPAEI